MPSKLQELEKVGKPVEQAKKKTQAITNHQRSSARKRPHHGARLTLTQGQRDAISKRQHHLVHALIFQEAPVERPRALTVHAQLLPRQLLALAHGIVDCQKAAHPKQASVHDGLVESQVARLVDIQEDEVERGTLYGQG